jgi:hypothetical protein
MLTCGQHPVMTSLTLKMEQHRRPGQQSMIGMVSRNMVNYQFLRYHRVAVCKSVYDWELR